MPRPTERILQRETQRVPFWTQHWRLRYRVIKIHDHLGLKPSPIASGEYTIDSHSWRGSHLAPKAGQLHAPGYRAVSTAADE